jgi:urea transport system ATP-binding protein
MHKVAAGSLLYLDNVTVSFDGFRALNGLSLVLAPGEMRAIIGPNGAGKTTMMDVITGKTRPANGEVYFDGAVDLTRLDEADIASLGIGRKFQKPTVFESHTVTDNVELALDGNRSPFNALFGRRDADTAERLDAILRTVRLDHLGDAPAAALSHGQKQRLEIAMLLAQDPKLLLIDEPAAGMSDAETAELSAILGDIAANHTVMVVEHDMAFVRGLGVKCTVLHDGAVLAEGSFDQVSRNERVIEVYLGR